MIPEDLLASLEQVAKLPAVEDFISSLLLCKRNKNLAHAKRLHAHIFNNNYIQAHEELGNYLVPTLVDCGSLYIAQQVFNRLDYPKACSWTALVQGFTEEGEFQQALNIVQRMQADHVRPSCHTFQALVKTCVRSKNLDCGQELHIEIIKSGHDNNQIVGVTLVDMYVKAGSFAEAWTVLEKLPAQDVVAWNIFITDYTECGLGGKALKCFELMQNCGISPDVVTLSSSLKACTVVQSAHMGREIHVFIAKLGFEGNIIICNSLVDMYAKTGSLEEAQAVFDKMLIRNVVSWNALLAGYAEHGLENEALNGLQKMHLEGLSSTHVTVTCGLNCCGNLGEIDRGWKLHADIVKWGLDSHLSVGSSLVAMYMSVGWINEGQHVFDGLPIQNVISWTALITGYAEHGLVEAALEEFSAMQSEGVPVDALLYACILECCCTVRRIDKILQIHCDLAKDGLELDDRIASALLNAYTCSGWLSEAQDLFDEFSLAQALLCNVSAAWYAENSLGTLNLLSCVEEMLQNGSFFSSSMLVGSLKACASVGAINTGCIIHMMVTIQGLEKDPSLSVALVAMFSKCGCFAEAHYIVDSEQQMKNGSSWNVLIARYADHFLFEQVFICLEKMQMQGVHPNEATFVCGLKACGSLGAVKKCFELHRDILSEGFERDSLIGNALVAVYAKHGLLAEALEVSNELAARDVVSWNSVMAGHADCGSNEEVLNCWEQMHAEHISPNCVSYVLILKACSSIGEVDKSLQFHTQVIERGFEENTYIAKYLVDTYAKSGLLAEAWKVFNMLPIQDVVLWTALIGGSACCGHSKLVFDMLERMREEGVQPNERTYVYILTVCSHSGLVEEGCACFQDLHKDCGVLPLLEHYNCMADLCGRAGQLEMGTVLLEKMPFQPDLVAWRAIMGASRKWRNLEVGRQAFESVMGLSDKEAAACMLMLNIYADPEEACRERERERERAWEQYTDLASGQFVNFFKC